MIKVILFDFDGVIVESCDIKTEAFAKLFAVEEKADLKAIVSYHKSNAGVSRFEKFKHIYRAILKRPLSGEEFRGLCDRFSRLVMESVIGAPYVKGAMEFLKKYSSIYKYFLLSATPQEELNEIVSRRGIGSFFGGIYGAPNRKKDIVKDILVGERIIPQDALYVGDAMSDYKASEENGIGFIARLHNCDSIFKDIDCPKIKDLTCLEGIIKRL